MSDLISVIIPAYNVGAYLENCINSILKQSYSAIEIILVDDGSTDNTPQIADGFQIANPDRVYVIHTQNNGVTRARLEGIKAARGVWIGFVDGDDEIEPDMYERLYMNAIKYDADISHCGYQTIVDGGSQIYYFHNTGNLMKQDTHAGLVGLLSGSFEPSLCTKLFRKELLCRMLKDNIMDTSIKYNEDALMNFYLFRDVKRSIYEDFCGYHYLSHSTSATHKTFCLEKVIDPIKASKAILKCTTGDLKDIAWRRYLGTCMGAYSVLVNKKNYRKTAVYCRKILLKNKGKWYLMRRNDRLKTIALIHFPKVYSFFYGVYESYFQVKKYY